MRSRKKTQPQPSSKGLATVGLAWFERDQWERLRDVAADPEILDDSYEEWLEGATQLAEKLKSEGVPIQPVTVFIDALVAWCDEQQLPVDSGARAKYAAALLKSRYDEQSGAARRRRR
jgi:hypothetical protein